MPQCDWGGNGQRSEEVVNINKKHFLMIGSSFGVPWFFFGSSLVFSQRKIEEVQRKGILIIVLFVYYKQNAIYVCSINGVLVKFYFMAINN